MYKTKANTDVVPPAIRSFNEFRAISETFGQDENGNLKFRFSKFFHVDRDDHSAWLGTLDIRRGQASIEQAIGCLRRVPDAEIYPPSDSDASIVAAAAATSNNLPQDTWMKRPNITVHNQTAGTTRIADEFQEEILVCREIQMHPHPNLLQFKGCLQKDGRIVGLLLKRYSITLSWRVEGFDQPPIDRQAYLDGIQAGVEHLHSLGFAHNDLSPYNIMIDEQDRPVIIDMGSAKKFGEELSQMGTPDWNDGFLEVSSKENDEIGLRKIREWISARESSCSG